MERLFLALRAVFLDLHFGRVKLFVAGGVVIFFATDAAFQQDFIAFGFGHFRSPFC
jgi:hypothetical protein